ncbi:hypothetical protein GUJ93_ZPchr0009g665 [Zizania palustris]|uniref:Uncharacterized protein n=1 Tax=Zizania palustris TaxID=103762 RepID=A0A8J5RHH4_ZIZPA|nr:hypothetical protein GUJ93_ZPchr0009g665 [Zizania palustris]
MDPKHFKPMPLVHLVSISVCMIHGGLGTTGTEARVEPLKPPLTVAGPRRRRFTPSSPPVPAPRLVVFRGRYGCQSSPSPLPTVPAAAGSCRHCPRSPPPRPSGFCDRYGCQSPPAAAKGPRRRRFAPSPNHRRRSPPPCLASATLRSSPA